MKAAASRMAGRLIHSADFQRVLATAAKVRSAHFAAHLLQDRPMSVSRNKPQGLRLELSTEVDGGCQYTVDKSDGEQWLGLVVPKRLARRAVTRQLLKRQMREAMRRHGHRLGKGLWVLRLLRAFDSRQYPAAASAALRRAARTELDSLLARASASD